MKKEVLKKFEDPRAAEWRKKIFFHKNCPPFQYFFTDDEGYLFVMTHEEGENPREYVCTMYSALKAFLYQEHAWGIYALSIMRTYNLLQQKTIAYTASEKKRVDT